MTANVNLQGIRGDGWQRGLAPLMRREMRNWWGNRRWIIQTLLWAVVRVGGLAFGLYALPAIMAADGMPVSQSDALDNGIQMFFGLGLVGLAIGAVVMLQDAIIEEKASGTAEWVLSKPVSRTAYVIAKLLPNLFGMFVTMILIPVLLGYALLRSFGAEFTASQFLFSEGIVILNLFFYVTLTLMLGVLFQSRGPLLAIALGSLFGGSLVPIAAIAQFTPWHLGNLVILPMMGMPLPPVALIMLASTAVWSILFIAVAIWRFNKQEF